MSQVADNIGVISPWWSTINWTQAVAALSMVMVLVFGQKAALTPEQQAAIVVVIGLLCNAGTVVLRTWYSPTVMHTSLSEPQKLTLRPMR